MSGSPLKSTLGLGLFLGVIAAAASLTASSGCDDGSTGGGGADPCAVEIGEDKCFQQDCVTPSTAPVSFATDVLPVFEQSCSLSTSCHGDASSPTSALGYQPYLGEVNPETMPSDIDLIFSTNVGVVSPTSTQKIVDPGHPETSYLMHKMDGDVECPDLGCPADDCGDTMPQGSPPLSRASRDIVRAWIQQGAQQN